MKALTEKQIRTAMEAGEFGEDVVRSGKTVVVALSQDWCPQWKAMKEWIGRICEEAGAVLYAHEYNKHAHFDDFLELKENVWKNLEIPYLRIYRNGRKTGEFNNIPPERLAALLKS